MTDNFVIITAQWDDGNPLTPSGSGNYEIVATGLLMESASIGVVTPIILGQLDSLGSFSQLGISSPIAYQDPNAVPNSGIPLLASDNFGAGEFNWNFKVVVAGAPIVIANNVPINYALGGTQGLFAILEAAGWSPTVPPAF
jgi:hypothetical protein